MINEIHIEIDDTRFHLWNKENESSDKFYGFKNRGDNVINKQDFLKLKAHLSKNNIQIKEIIHI